MHYPDAISKLNEAKQQWHLVDDGEILTTQSSLLQPVLYKGTKAMLKIALHAEELRGAKLMTCWNGNAAAKVLQAKERVLLMERATGKKSLRQMVLSGVEDEANRIICSVAAKLHRANCKKIAELTPLKMWFSDLAAAHAKYGGVFGRCWDIADHLLNNQQDIVALHGDIHYDNILDSGGGEWIAIDPKALIGERTFDFANLFCNPTAEIAASETRMKKQVPLVAHEAGVHAQRLLQWIVAWSGLSATWILNKGDNARTQIIVAENALKELANH